MASKAKNHTDFVIGGKTYSVPPMNLLANRYYTRTISGLYRQFRDVNEAYRAAVAAHEMDSTSPEPDPSDLAQAQADLMDAQIEVVAIRLASTAQDPAEQDEEGVETFAHMTAERIKEIMLAEEQEAWSVAMGLFVAASGFVRRGEPIPAGNESPSVSRTPTKSSTRSRSR